METLREHYEMVKEVADSKICTFTPEMGRTPSVASPRSLQLAESLPLMPTQLTMDQLPVPTGYYDEIQKIKDKNNFRVAQLEFKRLLGFREVWFMC